jgi:hypothetical protein
MHAVQEVQDHQRVTSQMSADSQIKDMSARTAIEEAVAEKNQMGMLVVKYEEEKKVRTAAIIGV